MVWFPTPPPPCFGLGMVSTELPNPPSPPEVYLGTHVLSGKGRGEGSILSLCHVVFLWLLGKHLHMEDVDTQKRGS